MLTLYQLERFSLQLRAPSRLSRDVIVILLRPRMILLQMMMLQSLQIMLR